MKEYKAGIKGDLRGLSFDTDSYGERKITWTLREGDEVLVRETKSFCNGVAMYRVLDKAGVGTLPATAISIIGEAKYEQVDHPTHYNNYTIECIEMMRRIWGDETTAQWCEMTAFKYRMRVGTKPDNPIEQDLSKEEWYLTKAKELRQ